jgi:hypothetical protein
MRFTFIIILFVIVSIISVGYYQMQTQDSFTPSFSLIVDEKPEVLNIIVPDELHLDNKSQLLTRLASIKHVQLTRTPNALKSNTTLYLQDAFTYFLLNNHRTHRMLNISGIERYFYLIRPLDIPTKDMFDDNVMIGYTTDTQRELLKVIFGSLKQGSRVPLYQLKKVHSTGNISKSLFTNEKIDLLATFSALDIHQSVLSPEFKVDISDYGEQIDIHKLRATIPFVKKANVDFSMYFPQLKGKRAQVKQVLSFDILVYGKPYLEQLNVKEEMQSILNLIKSPETINFYAQFFDIFLISEVMARKLNDFTQRRGSLQILEQFEASPTPFKYVSKSNVPGYYDSNTRRFIVSSSEIDLIPLTEGMYVTLTKQTRADQNGEYTITSVSQNQSVMTKNTTSTTGSTNSTNTASTQFEPGYLCYDHPELSSKALCDSMYEPTGALKKKKTYWDKPCEKHSDCPFYQANKTYPNYRGGCIDGRCEMPIGIEQVSFRLYDKDASDPFCHDCVNKLNPRCCNSQVKPNYAFELDHFERRASNNARRH